MRRSQRLGARSNATQSAMRSADSLLRLSDARAMIYLRDRTRYLRALRSADAGDREPIGELLPRAVLDNLYGMLNRASLVVEPPRAASADRRYGTSHQSASGSSAKRLLRNNWSSQAYQSTR